MNRQPKCPKCNKKMEPQVDNNKIVGWTCNECMEFKYNLPIP